MILKTIYTLSLSLTLLVSTSCASVMPGSKTYAPQVTYNEIVDRPALEKIDNAAVKKILKNSFDQIGKVTGYTQKYYTLTYPNGDVPSNTGACTDVVIRSFRAAGTDLQKEVHEDMRSHFGKYPKKWGLKRPDKNIDHRRVPNLDTYFTREGKSLPITTDGTKFKPGDVVAWDLNGRGMTHIGVVSNKWNTETKRYLIIHNIGFGAQLEDRLFDWKIIGHYRYF